MIKFFRDVLDGPLYIVLVIIAIILIMAIIGFILERKQKLVEKQYQFAHVDATVSNVNHGEMITPVNKVDIDTNTVNNNVVGDDEAINQMLNTFNDVVNNTMPDTNSGINTSENNDPNM